VAETLEPKVSRITLVTSGDDDTIEKIVKQVDKLPRVISVVDLTMVDHIEREMVVVHVNAEAQDVRREVMKLANVLDARVIDVSENVVTVEATGERHRIDALLRLMRQFGIQEIARAGTLAIRRLSVSSDESEEHDAGLRARRCI